MNHKDKFFRFSTIKKVENFKDHMLVFGGKPEDLPFWVSKPFYIFMVLIIQTWIPKFLLAANSTETSFTYKKMIFL